MDGAAAPAPYGGINPSSRLSQARRRYVRHLVSPLAYVRLDHSNGGIIRDLSESGMAIQAVAPLRPGQVVHLRFDLLRPRIRIETGARVTWAESSGQAGLVFLDLPARNRRLLKDWLLVTLLAAAAEFSLRNPIFKTPGPASSLDGLIVSDPPHPAIHLAPPDPPVRALSSQTPLLDEEEAETAEMPVRLPWWPADISPGSLAAFVDTLMVVTAVLLFAIVFVATTGMLPSWLVLSAVTVIAACSFGLIYQYLFSTFSEHTLGRKLARLAAEDQHWTHRTEPDPARFR